MRGLIKVVRDTRPQSVAFTCTSVYVLLMDHQEYVAKALEKRYRGRASLDWDEVAITAISALIEFDEQLSVENGFPVSA